LRIHNLELQIGGKVSSAEVDQKFKRLELNLASINNVKFEHNRTSHGVTSGVSLTVKMEDIINDMKDIKNIS
jgi:hypothetical protein